MRFCDRSHSFGLWPLFWTSVAVQTTFGSEKPMTPEMAMVHADTRVRKRRVVIVGAGFAGLSLAKGLANSEVQITLIDRHNYHLFQPLLYQVATAGLSPAEIASPIRNILRDQKNATVILAEVSGVDVTHKDVIAEGRRIPYDTLVLATGVE